jgi:Na+-transporting methylmalonyl-CoA/oxaloacetate decarboxylase beta subunit
VRVLIISKTTGNIFGDMEASAASIAIIGGQDGPTAIFSANNQSFFYTYSVYIIALLIFLALYFPLKKYLES